MGLLFGADGTSLALQHTPSRGNQPTGASDAFAGGFRYLRRLNHNRMVYAIDEIKRGVVHGNIIGSYVCEDFSIDRLRMLTMDDVAARYPASLNILISIPVGLQSSMNYRRNASEKNNDDFIEI
jgi:hypothetical protein